MTASADSKPPLATWPVGPSIEPGVEYNIPSMTSTNSATSATSPTSPTSATSLTNAPANLSGHPRMFKKHKVLPHPKNARVASRGGLQSAGPKYDLTVDTSRSSRSSGSQSPNLHALNLPLNHALKHQPRRIGTGPDMPPTPPAHSRNSSSSHSAIPSTPTYGEAPTPDTSTEDVQVQAIAAARTRSPPRTPRTPTNQRSPPTPDVTPPQTMETQRRTTEKSKEPTEPKALEEADEPRDLKQTKVEEPEKPKEPMLPMQPKQTEKRPRMFRPPISDRIPSKATTDSRTESFKTARENPYSSEEEDSKSTLRPILPSVRTSSQSTVRQVNGEGSKKTKTVGLGLGLESSPESNVTPTSPISPTSATERKSEFISFDGEWGGENEVEQVWDDNLGRNVTVRKHYSGMYRHGQRPQQRWQPPQEVLEDNPVSPTNAAKAVRSMRLPERILTFPSPPRETEPIKKSGPPPGAVTSAPAAILEPSPNIDSRRFSGMSSKSTVSTVVEAILVETPPRRQRTLRHVRKQIALRGSGSDLSPASSSAPTSIQLEAGGRLRPRPNGKIPDARHESYMSTSTNNSISSRKARRDVWRSGGIPVVVVPDRRSSIKSSRTPSLRSTSSRRSKRSQSLSSAPLSQVSKTKDLTPYFERPSRRGRTMPESDGDGPTHGEQRTIDYPPVVPVRTSSLSAPTSRNTSRAGSLTANSLKEHNLNTIRDQLQAKLQKEKQKNRDAAAEQEQQVSRSSSLCPEVRIESVPSAESMKAKREHPMHKVSVDHHGDPLFGKRLSAQQTPFSMTSVETNATSHAEVSEAFAMNIYPHQNTSVLMVDHSAKPSETSESSSYLVVKEIEHEPPASPKLARTEALEAPAPTLQRPVIKTTDTDAGTGPVTPPQPTFSMEDVDSPLRNPRAPPAPPVTTQPPAIQFIPATPSGLTPAQEKEKHLGNFYDEMTPRPPMRRLSLVRRALSGRRHSEYGSPPPSRSARFLTRTFSLTRGSSLRRDAGEGSGVVFGKGKGKSPAVMGPDDEPADETRLHPFWRPAYSDREDDYDDEREDDYFGEDESRQWRRQGRYYDEDADDWRNEGDFSGTGRTYRYPPIDNRPARSSRAAAAAAASANAPLPRRSFSQRMKRTFAILPLDMDGDEYDDFPSSGFSSPIRRTVRRTTSGNLRVVKRRGSFESLKRRSPRPYESVMVTRPFSSKANGSARARLNHAGDSDGSSRRRPHTAPDADARGGTVRPPPFFSWRSSTSGGDADADGGESAGGGGLSPRGSKRRLLLLLPARLSGGLSAPVRRLSERRREKRSQELRRTISAPREVRDGVGDVIRRSSYRDAYTQAAPALPSPPLAGVGAGASAAEVRGV